MTTRPLDSPADRLLQQGPGALTDAELVSILLRGSSPKVVAPERAQAFLDVFGGYIPGLLACNATIARAQNLSAGAAAGLLAAIELGRRLPRAPEVEELPQNPWDVAAYLRLRVGAGDQSIFGAIFVDAENGMLGFFECFRGTTHHLVIDTKTILREALCRNASGIFLFHFKPAPSKVLATREDSELLEKMLSAGTTLGFHLIDYLIFGSQKWHSMRSAKPW